MKKHNPGSVTVTEQRRKELAKARRIRRQTKLAELVTQKLRVLLLENGKLQQQVKQMEISLNEFRKGVVPDQQGTDDSGPGEAQQADGVGAPGVGPSDQPASAEARGEG
jgi:hypothetical protein